MCIGHIPISSRSFGSIEWSLSMREHLSRCLSMRAAQWLHRHLARPRAVVAFSRLTPTEQRVLQLLQTDASEGRSPTRPPTSMSLPVRSAPPGRADADNSTGEFIHLLSRLVHWSRKTQGVVCGRSHMRFWASASMAARNLALGRYLSGRVLLPSTAMVAIPLGG